jgi:hypothetical protein
MHLTAHAQRDEIIYAEPAPDLPRCSLGADAGQFLYPTIRMSDDLVIFVRCDSAEEKRAFAAAAAGLAATEMETNTHLYRATTSSPYQILLIPTQNYSRKHK